MELSTLKKTDTELELEIHGENETFLVPLLHRLLEDTNVDYATYMMGHILMDNPRLYVRVTKGTPEEALTKAAETIKDDLSALREEFTAKVAQFEASA